MKLTTAQAEACAEKLARALVATPKLVHKSVSADSWLHWFELAIGPGQDLAVVVDDGDCSATFAPSVGAYPRFDVGTAKRYLKLHARAWAAIRADPERQALCRRLSKLKTKHANLVGCVTWLDSFPGYLCRPPAPGVAAKQPYWGLQHKCYWRFYLGENMTDHTNRHFTLVVDANAGHLVGAMSVAGTPFPASVWSKAPALRRVLTSQLKTAAAVVATCKASSSCPTVGSLSSFCSRCFDVQLREPAKSWGIEVDARGKPTRVYDGTDEKGQAFANWLTTLNQP